MNKEQVIATMNPLIRRQHEMLFASVRCDGGNHARRIFEDIAAERKALRGIIARIRAAATIESAREIAAEVETITENPTPLEVMASHNITK